MPPVRQVRPPTCGERQMKCRHCHLSKSVKAFPRKGQQCKACRQVRATETRSAKSYDDFMPVVSKSCSQCGVVRPASEFQRTKNNRTGLSSQCKACRSIYFKTQHEGRTFNRTKSKWHMIKANARKRDLVCDLTYEDYVAWWDGTPDICHYCERTIEEFLDIKTAIMGRTLPAWKRFQWFFANPSFQRIVDFTIDRKDSTGHYTLDNLAKACWVCNSIKGSIFTAEQMRAVAALMRDDFTLTTEESQ